jgi:hypothetical protein
MGALVFRTVACSTVPCGVTSHESLAQSSFLLAVERPVCRQMRRESGGLCGIQPRTHGPHRQLLATANKQTPWPLVRKRTIPNDRQPLHEILVPTFGDRGVSRCYHGGSPMIVNLSFLDWSRYFFLQVAPHLSSQGLNGPRSRPTASTQKQTPWLLVRKLIIPTDSKLLRNEGCRVVSSKVPHGR